MRGTLKISDVEKACGRIYKYISQPNERGCMEWIASIDTAGYGQIRIAGSLQLAHRMVFYLKHGYLPVLVMHSCDNPPCCNIEHLKEGTKKKNSDDMISKGRKVVAFGKRNGAYTHPEKVHRGDCHYSRLHPEKVARGENSGAAKYSDATIQKVREEFSRGEIQQCDLVKKYGISASHISRIIRGRAR